MGGKTDNLGTPTIRPCVGRPETDGYKIVEGAVLYFLFSYGLINKLSIYNLHANQNPSKPHFHPLF